MDNHNSETVAKFMSFELLSDITNKFSEEIGRGGFGKVFKGVLDGEDIAVKMLHQNLGHDKHEELFVSEFKNLRGVFHPNIVKLLGYCYETKHQVVLFDGKLLLPGTVYSALCFEYMHGGSLQKHLYEEHCGHDWQTRYKIIKGTCEGLQYLHEGLEAPVYHLDLKPDNILLDKNMVPKLADFGLSKLVPDGRTIATENCRGTWGYMPPESIDNNLVSNKFDIFSLGVVMIRIIAGYDAYRKSYETPSAEFVDHVHENWRNRLCQSLEGTALDAVCNQVKRCIEIALDCVKHKREDRPTIGKMIDMLNETEPMIQKMAICLPNGLRNDLGSKGKKVDAWRKGKSEVIETNHILILGWSNKLGSLLMQLAIANKSIGGDVVVVLAERDKEEMEMDIEKLEFDFMGTSVICRSGSPLIFADLKKVSVSEARAIIVLASDETAESDSRALRVLLSLTGVKEGLRGHVVAEMSDLDNEPVMKLVGGELIETVVAHDMIGRLMIQCALQPGLAQIWEGILGFENAGFYIKKWPELNGMRFGDVLISFPDAVPCGIKVAFRGGEIIINPDDDYVLRDGDEVLVIAEDDDTYAPAPRPEVNKDFLPNIPNPPKYPEKILFCGWRRDIHDMIMVLDASLAPGSELWMFNEVPEKEREIKLNDGGLDIGGLTNIKLVHKEGNAVIRRHLESLPLEAFDSILILADESVDSIEHSDSRSAAALLLIRNIQFKRLPSKELKSPLCYSGFSHSSWIREMQHASGKSMIISEILDSRTRNLVSVTKIRDYVMSNELVSMALAMVAKDKQINRVLEELFAEEGNEMCIRSAEFYLYEQEELSFFDIMVRAREREEIVIGYRLVNADQAIINPEHKTEIRKWSLDDVFVVISKGD